MKQYSTKDIKAAYNITAFNSIVILDIIPGNISDYAIISSYYKNKLWETKKIRIDTDIFGKQYIARYGNWYYLSDFISVN